VTCGGYEKCIRNYSRNKIHKIIRQLGRLYGWISLNRMRGHGLVSAGSGMIPVTAAYEDCMDLRSPQRQEKCLGR